MSYIRGRYYAYSCGDGRRDLICLHGDPSGCGCDQHDKTPSLQMPMSVFDELVLYRFAEMLRENIVKKSINRIVKEKRFGNFGSYDLANLAGYDPGDDFAKECARRQTAHLSRCKHPRSCKSPGYHRHKHRGKAVKP